MSIPNLPIPLPFWEFLFMNPLLVEEPVRYSSTAATGISRLDFWRENIDAATTDAYEWFEAQPLEMKIRLLEIYVGNVREYQKKQVQELKRLVAYTGKLKKGKK